jgi:hypothetical protein
LAGIVAFGVDLTAALARGFGAAMRVDFQLPGWVSGVVAFGLVDVVTRESADELAIEVQV